MAASTPGHNAATVLLVDNHPQMREELRMLLQDDADLTVVGEAGDGREALEQVRALSPDVVVLGLTMPNMNGIEATRRILAEAPDTRVVALSIHAEKRCVDDMLKAGASACVLKDSAAEELVRAIHAVLRGEAFLSGPILVTVVSGYRKSMDVPAAAVEEDTVVSVEHILQTKLHHPVLPVDLVPRTKLIARLEAERARPLTLVSASAGYGKSVLVSSWLEQCDWPGTWLSLDEDDSDLRQFLIYFVAAVRSLFPQACEDSLGLGEAHELPPVTRLAAVLANELDALEQPFILVLDDYHRISVMSPVHDLLQQLLVRPPIPLHLAILSRRDPPLPLVTLRARGQVTEVRTEDLRFSKLETRLLIKNILGFTATDELLANLDDEMEGWVVGLQLMSLASRRSEDPGGFLMQQHGGTQQIQEFIAHEVIDRQPHGLRDWLLKSAILDRFCVQLCDAVCASGEDVETPPLEGGRFIEFLREKNLFVISMGTQGEWFRYHHLFQAALLCELTRRLAVDEIAALHMHASQWFESHGFIDEALQH
ncbi:MAG: response regulator, partial [Gammaproteobacteria bacterium]